MGLITLILLLALTIVYLYNSLEHKPEFMSKAFAFINENMKYAHFAAAYALVAMILCWFTKFALLKFVANLLILIMLSPGLNDKFSTLIAAKGGEKAQASATKAVELIKKYQEYISYVALGVSALMFLLMF